MAKIADVQRLICPKGNTVHNAVRLHVLPNNRQEVVRVCGGDNRGVDLPAPLQQPEDEFAPVLRWTPMISAAARAVASATDNFRRAPS